jgi:hypothetical protein
MPHKANGEAQISRITGEPRHWLEYGVFAFVVVTAIATATAAWYTRKESETTAENGRRQLRAYVFPDQANLIWQGAARPMTAEIVIKNSGQTPAYRLSTATVAIAREFPLQGDVQVPPMPDTHTVVPPNGSYALSVVLAQSLTGDQLKSIQKGTQAIYAFGEVSYVDAFGECRMTQYKFYYTGTGADVGNRVGMTYLDEGNTEVPCPRTQ